MTLRLLCLLLFVTLLASRSLAQVANPGTLTATPNPGTVQNTYSLSATFGNTAGNTPAGSAAGVPTGIVTFKDGSSALSTATLTPGALGLVPGNTSTSVRNGQLAYPARYIVGDLNGDGIPDILIIEAAGLYTLFGKADGTFTSVASSNGISQPNVTASGCPYVIDAAVGTLLVPSGQTSGDDQDIALLCSSSAFASSSDLYVFQNVNNSGTFQQFSHLANLPFASHIIIGTFRASNAQNDLFLTVPGADSSAYGLTLFGQSSGYFYYQPGWMSKVPMPEAQYATQLQALDFNGDFHDDLVLLSTHPGTSDVLNVFQAGAGGVLPSTSTYTLMVGDGSADSSFALVHSALNPNYPYHSSGIAYRGVGTDTSLHLVSYTGNTSTVSFGTPTTLGGSGFTSLAGGDFNGDGFSDLVGETATGAVHVFTQAADGSLGEQTSFAQTATAGSVLLGSNISYSYQLTDPNGDGYADPLTFSSNPSNTSTIWQQQYLFTTGQASATLGDLSFAAGSHALTAAVPARTTLSAGSASATLVVNRLTPTVSWNPNPATIAYGTPLSGAQLDATTNVPGAFSYNPGPGTVLTGGQQTLSVTFTPTDTATFAPVMTTATVTVTQGQPTVTWTPNPASIAYGTGLSAAQLDATASVPGTFTYTPAVGTVLPAGPQTLSTLFTPTDTTDYGSVTKTTTITVTQGQPTVTWTPNPSNIPYGTALSAAQLDATASVPGTFTYTPAVGTVLPAGPQTLSVTFTPTDTADYAPVTRTTAITVTQGQPTVAWTPNPSNIPYGTALSAAQLDATASVPGTFTYTPAVGTVLPAGPQTLSLTFTPTDTANYAPITRTTTITVTQGQPTVTWAPNPTTIAYGTALSAAQLDATSSVPGTFTYTPAVGTVLPAGTQTLSLTFSPTDTANYAPITRTTTIAVGKSTPNLIWPMPADLLAGMPLSSIQLNATANVPGTFAYTPAAGTVLVAGPQTLSVTFTPNDTTDYVPTSATVQLQVVALALNGLSPAAALLGDPSKTITLQGVGFAPNAVVTVGGTAVSTAYLSSTTLTAQVPASFFLQVASLSVLVTNPSLGTVSKPIPLTVTAPAVGTTLSGPSATTPGAQPYLLLALTNSYPVPLTVNLGLTFTPQVGLVDDPAIQFANGGRTQTFTIPANSIAIPAIALQSGSVAGVIRVTPQLLAGGVDVTPATLQPVTITDAVAVPQISSPITLSRSGNTFTATIQGLSNTREIAATAFHFDPAPGATLNTRDLTIAGSPLFTNWYASAASQSYGSTFVYTQTFTIDQDASAVGSVSVTLSNSVGSAGVQTAQ